MNVRTTEKKILAGHILAAVALGMCNTVYTRQEHQLYCRLGQVSAEDYKLDRQKNALTGALCAHFCISAFERITTTLVQWDIAKSRNSEIFVMQIDATDIPNMVLNRSGFSTELFREAIEAFFNFEFQPGWPESHFPIALLSEFRDAGLVEDDAGDLNWTLEMLRYFDHTLAVPWDPDSFFERLCK
ncbi:MAG: hypothetical protein AAGA50_27655 [Pseudomonadota bacterium]